MPSVSETVFSVSENHDTLILTQKALSLTGGLYTLYMVVMLPKQKNYIL
jgi:hypothetical protein